MEKQQLTTKSLRQFLEQKDLGLLEDPITFAKTDKFKGLLCCTGCINCWASMWVTACFCPISVFCPGTTFKHYGLKLDKTSVQMSDAVNDCCCHVATAQKTVPLDKIQDVQLTESCLLTCFGLKQVNVQTAADGGTGASEVGVAFLEHPEEAREAIQLAVKLHQQAHTAPAQAAMSRGGSSMAARLQRLKDMEAKGWLSEKEASQAKVPLLAAEGDPTLRLWEAGELLGKGLVTQEEFNRVKSAIISQISKH